MKMGCKLKEATRYMCGVLDDIAITDLKDISKDVDILHIDHVRMEKELHCSWRGITSHSHLEIAKRRHNSLLHGNLKNEVNQIPHPWECE